LNYIYSIAHVVQPKIILSFDKNMCFEEYSQNKILFRKLDSYNDEVPKNSSAKLKTLNLKLIFTGDDKARFSKW
jgi:hypothetical protein